MAGMPPSSVSTHLACRIHFCVAFTITLHRTPTASNGGSVRAHVTSASYKMWVRSRTGSRGSTAIGRRG